jgi:hypothetical protein
MTVKPGRNALRGIAAMGAIAHEPLGNPPL